jgi:hypothetical protein
MERSDMGTRIPLRFMENYFGAAAAVCPGGKILNKKEPLAKRLVLSGPGALLGPAGRP